MNLPSDSGANFSPCRNYRYLLWRRWDESLPAILFIGLNPSTANETVNDPTITREVGFAKRWGFGGYVKANLFALRATDPKVMKRHDSPVGEDNDKQLIVTMRFLTTAIVTAWGADGSHRGRDTAVYRMIRHNAIAALHLGLTKHGHPRHPLYLRSNTEAVPWTSQQLAMRSRES